MTDITEILPVGASGLFEQYPVLDLVVGLLLLILAAWIGNWIVKRIMIRGLFRALRATPLGQEEFLHAPKVIPRLANIVPALIISAGISLIPDLPDSAVTIVRNTCSAFIVLTIALAIGSSLTLVNTIYERRPDAQQKPIKGYLQLLKIVVYLVAAILVIAALIDRSPLILLSGLGAIAAVLMLIFQDTLLSLVASVLISSNDLVRVGDWIEMPELNADGDVIDISLHTVKVQNWDKTIATIPTKRFLSDPFKNWRGMQEAGGRRIKRSILLDQQSIRFLTDEEGRNLRRFRLLGEYLDNKRKEIDEWNRQLGNAGENLVNTRRITNLGTFRAYVVNYLRSRPDINQNLTLMVRQRDPTAEGLPLEIYCFTGTTEWIPYEGIQSDIFDHLLAILPEFGLTTYQHPSGVDLREIGRRLGTGGTTASSS